MWLVISALAAPVGVLLPDRTFGQQGLDHRAVVLTGEEAQALRDAWERGRQSSWTPDCPGSHLLLLREGDGQSWLPVLDERGEPIAFGGHPWRWDGRWPIGPSCMNDPDKLGPLLAQPLQRLVAARTFAYRVVLPVGADPPRADLVTFVLEAGQAQVELEIAGSMHRKDAQVQLDALLEDKLYAIAAELAPFGVVRVDRSGGHGGYRGPLQYERRRVTLTMRRGADVSGLHDAAVGRGVLVRQLWQPQTWSWLVLLSEAEPGAAEALLRSQIPQALEVTPW